MILYYSSFKVVQAAAAVMEAGLKKMTHSHHQASQFSAGPTTHTKNAIFMETPLVVVDQGTRYPEYWNRIGTIL